MKASGFGGEDIVRDYIAKYSNWGRWGEDDQLGALNHVGPEQIKAQRRDFILRDRALNAARAPAAQGAGGARTGGAGAPRSDLEGAARATASWRLARLASAPTRWRHDAQ